MAALDATPLEVAFSRSTPGETMDLRPMSSIVAATLLVGMSAGCSASEKTGVKPADFASVSSPSSTSASGTPSSHVPSASGSSSSKKTAQSARPSTANQSTQPADYTPTVGASVRFPTDFPADLPKPEGKLKLVARPPAGWGLVYQAKSAKRALDFLAKLEKLPGAQVLNKVDSGQIRAITVMYRDWVLTSSYNSGIEEANFSYNVVEKSSLTS